MGGGGSIVRRVETLRYDICPFQGTNNTFSIISYYTLIGVFLADFRADTQCIEQVLILKIFINYVFKFN